MNEVVSFLKRPLVTASLVFVLLLFLSQLVTYQHYLLYQTNKTTEETDAANLAKEKLNVVLANSLSATQTLSFIVRKYGVKGDFEPIARQILESNKYIDALELVKGGVITEVYPLKGNEVVIGYDILRDSSKSIEAKEAIERKDLFFAGPLGLKQGGTAIIGRLPIFANDSFCGFAACITKLSTLIKATGLDTNQADYYFQLSKVNPTTHQEEFFLPDSNFIKAGTTVSVDVPNGNWKIYVARKHSSGFISLLGFLLLGLLLSITGGLFAFFISKQPAILKRLVERKSEQLRVSEENYENAIERVSDAIVSIDNEWRYTYLNKTALNARPDGGQDIVGRVIWDVYPEMRSSIFWDKFHEARDTKQVVEIENYYVSTDTWSSAKIYPSDNGLTIFYKDLTASRKAEKEIMREKSISESILNALPGIFYLYDRTGKFVRWNKNFEIVSGYSSEEIRHMHPLDFFDTDEKELLRSKIDAVFENGSADVGAHFFTKQGKKIPYYFNGHVANFDGIDYLLGVGIDITERKQAEMQLAKLNSELEIRISERVADLKEANKELEAFSYTVSHDLQSPLRAINGFTKILMGEYSDSMDDTGKEYLRIIGGSAKRMSELIKDLLVFAKLGKGSLEKSEANMRDIAGSIIGEVKSSHQNFATEIKLGQLPMAFCDQRLIRQVWYNLISNAVKYSKKKENPCVEIDSTIMNGRQVYYVRDNGAGFDMKHADKLFDVFKRLHSPSDFEGNGIGLATVYRIITKHGGEIWAEGKEQEGAIFYFTLPAIADGTEPI